MSLRTRLTLTFTFLTLVLIIFGLYGASSLQKINRQSAIHQEVLSATNILLEMELHQLQYVHDNDRKKANDVYLGFTALSKFTNQTSTELFSNGEKEAFMAIRSSLEDYDTSFQNLISLNSQLSALSVNLDNEIHKLNDNVRRLDYDDNSQIQTTYTLPMKLLEFYGNYSAQKNLNSFASSQSFDQLNEIQRIALDIQNSTDSTIEQQITGLRIVTSINAIKAITLKYSEKERSLEISSNSLIAKLDGIGHKLDTITHSQNTSMATVRRQVYTLLNIIIIFMIALSFSLIAYTLSYLTSNLSRILKATDKISEGDYNVRIDPIPNGEFGRLSSSINYMASSLDTSFTNQKDIASNLELMVNARTKELTNAKEALLALNHDLKHEKEKLAIMAITDELTGLYNRREALRFLQEQLNVCMRYGHPLTIMEVDIDHFKNVNDQYGHPAGDEVLRKLAHIFNDNIRDIDIVARFGGEEFLFIFPETSIEESKPLIERIQISVASTGFTFASINITFSAGVAQFSNETAIELIHKADLRLYKAKENGRNQVVTL